MFHPKTDALRKAGQFVQQGRIKSAIKEYEHLASSNPDDTNLLNILGDLYVRDGRTGDAIVTFVKSAEAALRDGHTPRAIAVYKKIYKLAPGDIDVALKLAELYLRRNLIAEACKQYLEVADDCTKNGRHRQALALLQRVADLDPENVPARLRLAETYQREGMTEQAVETYTAVGMQLLLKSNFVAAQPVFQRVLELNPVSTPALNSLATIYIKQGEPQRAAALLGEAARRRPDDRDILILSGRIYLQADLLNEAETALLKLLDVDQTRFEYVLTLAQKFIDKGFYDRGAELIEQCLEPMVAYRQETHGVELLQTIIEAQPYHLKAHQCLAAVYKRLGEDNELPGALKRLATAALHHGERSVAEQALRELVELEPNEPAHLETMRAYGFTGPVSPTIAEPGRAMHAPVYAGGVGQRVEFTPDILATTSSLPSVMDPGSEFGYTSGSGFAPLSPSVAPPPVRPRPAVVHGGEPLPADAARLKADAERFADLGMPDKAIELLQEVVGCVPDSIEIRLLLKQICTDVGRNDEAGRQAAALAALYAQYGDHAQSRRFQAEARQLTGLPAGGEFAASGSCSALNGFNPPSASADDEVEIDVSGPASPPVENPPTGVVPGRGVFEAPPAVSADAPAGVSVSGPASDDVSLNGLAIGEIEAPLMERCAAAPAPVSSSDSGRSGASSLQDVFDEFKQSVEADAEVSPDVETHYTLGLAYKDMGLFDEAVEAFQTAFRGTNPHSPDARYFQVCHLLGLCFMAKNEPHLAAVWFKRGVEAPGRTEDEYQAMRYDLGLAYEQMGRYDLALEVFEMVYAIDVTYREAAAKFSELRRRVKS